MISFSQFLAEAEAEKVISPAQAKEQLVQFFRYVTSTGEINDNKRKELAYPLENFIKAVPSTFTLTYKYEGRGFGEEQFDITFYKSTDKHLPDKLIVRNMRVGNSKTIVKETFDKIGGNWTNCIIDNIVPLFNKLCKAHNLSNIGRDTGFTGHGSQDSGPY